MKDRDILRLRDPPGGPVQIMEVRIAGAPVHVAQLVPGHREVGPELGDGQNLALAASQALAGGVDGGDAAQVGGRVGPPERALEVDQPAGGECGHDALLDLLFELSPTFVGDGGVAAKKMVTHCSAPFRLPIPSEPLKPPVVRNPRPLP